MASNAEHIKEACAAAATLAPEHEGLSRLAGTWNAEVKFWMHPDNDPIGSLGKMVNTVDLGGRFLRQEYRDNSGMFEGRGFWGYNTIDKCFEGFWIDSMATLFHLERGQHDEAKDVYTMKGTMTDPSSGKPLTKRSVITIVSPTEHKIEMFFQAEGGSENRTMEIRYTKA
jgi:hypothetical protein